MNPVAVDCPNCGDGQIVFGDEWVEPCDYCGNEHTDKW